MKTEPIQDHEDYSLAISFIEKNLRYLESLKLDSATLQAYRKVVAYLKNRSEQEIAVILGSARLHKKPVPKASVGLTNFELDALSSDQIRKMLVDPSVTRVILESVASVRFGVTKGALSQLRSIASLKEKIETLLAHEGTHAAITKAGATQADSSARKN